MIIPTNLVCVLFGPPIPTLSFNFIVFYTCFCSFLFLFSVIHQCYLYYDVPISFSTVQDDNAHTRVVAMPLTRLSFIPYTPHKRALDLGI